jgi:DNA-binding NarL/FixJ family response regulator
MIKILIADDHNLIIDGIKTTLEGIPDFIIVAEANNGIQVLNLLENTEVDIILMDINMPQMDGLDCTKKVCMKYPTTKIIGLSQFNEKRFVKRMIKNGASGYLLKDTCKEELIDAIRNVYNGEKCFNKVLMQNLLSDKLIKPYANSSFSKITDREKEILNLICNEYSTQDIADKFCISYFTAENHRANLIAKSGAKNTAGLVRWAIENDLIE